MSEKRPHVVCPRCDGDANYYLVFIGYAKGMAYHCDCCGWDSTERLTNE